MQTNFQSRLINTKAALVYFVTAQADGKPAWYYLQVDEPKHQAFKKQLETGKLNLSDYGTVLYSGWGTNAPDVIEARIREEFSAAA